MLVAVAVAVFFALLAIALSRVCLLLHRGKPRNRCYTQYESGFTCTNLPRYISEKHKLVAIYMIIELALTWLLICAGMYVH